MPNIAGSEECAQTSLRGIDRKARQDSAHRFRNLYGELNTGMLHLAWRKLKKSSAIADDDITVEEYRDNLEANLESLNERLKQKRYRAKLIKRRYIPKENGKQRPLGIPALEDKIVQKAAAMILEAIYEPVFYDSSYGYRPGRGSRDAVSDLSTTLHFGRFGLEAEPSKTQILRFSRYKPGMEKGKTFTFLGFEFFWFWTRSGKVAIKRRTAPKKVKAALQRMKEWLKNARNLPKELFFRTLKQKLTGHYYYYYVRGNSRSVWSFYEKVIMRKRPANPIYRY